MQNKLYKTIFTKKDFSRISLKTTDGKPCECEIIHADRIYKMIREGIPLTLHNKCILNFSMKKYRNKYDIASDDIVDIKFDSIYSCVFVGQDEVAADFSFCNFITTDDVAGIMMENNIFYNGRVDFSYSHFGDIEFSLKGCEFNKCELVFAHTEFGNRDIYFNDTVFNDSCDIQFAGTNFGDEGELTFRNMKGINNSGTIDSKLELYKCFLGEKTLDFSNIDCATWQFSFWEIETPTMPIDFVDSVVGMILLYKANINGLLDFRVSLAEHIVIQESVVRDCVLLGNQGYKNWTCYCLKNSALLGRLRIQNRFSKKLFDNQLQYAYDPDKDEIVLCPTSSTDKANQLTMLAENYQSEGDLDNADAAYVLSKRYRSKGRIHDLWTDYGAVGRTEAYQKSLLKRLVSYVTISVRLIGAIISWLFEKVLLDILCGNYATKPARFLFWMLIIITGFAFAYCGWLGTDVEPFTFQNPLFQSIESWNTAWLYSLQVFLQIEAGDIVPAVLYVYYIVMAEKVIGLAMFSIFVVSYTRKVIK